MKPKRTKKNHIAEWLDHPKAAALFGDTFSLHMDCLARILDGRGTFKEIAERHHVGPPAVSNIVKKQRAILKAG